MLLSSLHLLNRFRSHCIFFVLLLFIKFLLLTIFYSGKAMKNSLICVVFHSKCTLEVSLSIQSAFGYYF